MTYDPRTKALAEGLYQERTGKTVRVVADIAARNAIPAGERYNGLLVQVLAQPRKTYSWDGDSWVEVSGIRIATDITERDAIAADERYDGLVVHVLETRKLYSWDATAAEWVAITSTGGGIPKFATLADLQAATGMTDGDFATVLDTDKLYRYTNTAWVEFTSGSGGGGITKYATMAELYAVTGMEEGDMAVVVDTGMTMQYHDGAWVSAFNALIDPTAQSGWVLTTEFSSNAASLSGKNIDVSNCEKFRIEVDYPGAGITGHLNATFSSDTAANYANQVFYGQASTAGAGLTNLNGFRLVPAYAQGSYVLEFNKRTKVGTWRGAARHTGAAGQIVSSDGFVYLGTANMDTVVVNPTAYTFTGTIRVYKWVDGVRPVEVVSEELVKEWNLNNEVLDVTLPWDGELDDTAHVLFEGLSDAATPVYIALNGDKATANYPNQSLTGTGSAVAASSGSARPGLYIGYVGGRRSAVSDIFLKVANTPRNCICVGGNSANNALLTTSWSNTTSPVTALNVHSAGVAVSCRIRIYKKVKSQLATTNPNICTVWSKYIDANTVQVQPGEIEINGAIMKVTKAKNVTLSGNLRAGLTEAANTIYYMYAVRPESGNAPTFMFDTQAPLMDRYGNLVASFDDCTAARAWFHPTLGTGVRWIGQVRNDASSNILPYDKCMPGLWESAPAVIPAAGDFNVAHGFGRTKFNPRIVASEAISGALYECTGLYYYETESYGVLLSTIAVSGYAPKLANSLSMRVSPYMYRNVAGTWVKSGYYKLILTEG